MPRARPIHLLNYTLHGVKIHFKIMHLAPKIMMEITESPYMTYLSIDDGVSHMYTPLKVTFSSFLNPDVSTLTLSIARQQTNPSLGRARFCFAQERTHCGPVNTKR